MRPRLKQAIRSALAALVVSFVTVSAAHAQVLVSAERDLEFGLLTPGTVTTVAPADLTRSAQLRIEGRGTYQVSFQLPSSLVSLDGHQLPVLFAPTAGQLTIRHKVTQFDPATTVSFRINPAEQEALINIGGQAQPAPGQPAGAYTATIVMMVVQTGT